MDENLYEAFIAGQPTQVNCEMFIRSFGSISEKAMVRKNYCTHRRHIYCKYNDKKYFMNKQIVYTFKKE